MSQDKIKAWLDEIEERSLRNTEGLRSLKHPIDFELEMLNENLVILKLILIIRKQQEALEFCKKRNIGFPAVPIEINNKAREAEAEVAKILGVKEKE